MATRALVRRERRELLGTRHAVVKLLSLDLSLLGLGESVPHKITLSTIRIGELRMFAWPGEPTTTLGFDLKRAAPGAWILGLTNGYQGYFTSPGEFAEGRYEACSSLYGPRSGQRLVTAFTDLLHAAR